MLNMQNETNIGTAGRTWRSLVTTEGRTMNFYLAIRMETIEAYDSLNWKWWKGISTPHDIENVKTELVDIWHFILSQALVDAQDPTEALLGLLNDIDTDPHLDLFVVLDNIVLSSYTKNLRKIILRFNEACSNKLVQMSHEELFRRYVVKNVLNKFRQDNGYKSGTYKKMWNNEEDNVAALRLAANVTDPFELYESLVSYYAILS